MSKDYNDILPSPFNFTRIIITRKHLMHYDQYLDNKIAVVDNLLNSLNHFKYILQKHKQENRDLLVTQYDQYQFHISECEYAFSPDDNIDIWKSIDLFITKCNEFINESCIKLDHDLRTSDCREGMNYNFRELELIKQRTKHSS